MRERGSHSPSPGERSWTPPSLPRRGPERIPLIGNVFRLARLVRIEGAAGTVRRGARLARRWVRRARGRRPLRNLLAELRRSGRPVIVIASTVDWNIVLFQRPQQLARAFASLGRVCLYVTPNEVDEVAGHERIGPDLYLVDRLEPCFRALDRIVLFVPSPTPERFDVAGVRRARSPAGGRMLVVYDYLDAIHPDISPVSPERLAAHEEMLRTADLVTATARVLQSDAQERREGRVLLVPNAADLEHFRPSGSGAPWAVAPDEPTARSLPRNPAAAATAAGSPGPPARSSEGEVLPADESHRQGPAPSGVPAEMCEPGAGSGPIIGYSGALARWIDYDLLREVAERRPGWRIVLVGWDFDGSLAASHLLDLPNVLFLGPKPYETLPRYVAAFDVAILPFRVDDVTVATSPIKLFEYMAARKPIVATDLPECRGYASVSIGVGPGAFLACLERALDLRNRPDHLAILEREAAANTWASRARHVLDAVDGLARRP